MNISLSAFFVPENLFSRDGFGSPVPRQPAHLHTQAESGTYLRGSSRVQRRRPFFIYLHIEGRLNEGPRLQRKHKDETKQNKTNVTPMSNQSKTDKHTHTLSKTQGTQSRAQETHIMDRRRRRYSATPIPGNLVEGTQEGQISCLSGDVPVECVRLMPVSLTAARGYGTIYCCCCCRIYRASTILPSYIRGCQSGMWSQRDVPSRRSPKDSRIVTIVSLTCVLVSCLVGVWLGCTSVVPATVR